jgi:hypothetical protein
MFMLRGPVCSRGFQQGVYPSVIENQDEQSEIHLSGSATVDLEDPEDVLSRHADAWVKMKAGD